MASNVIVALALLTVCCLLSGVSSRPSDNESEQVMVQDEENPIVEESKDEREERAYPYYVATTPREELPESTREILDKIKLVNERLTKPTRHQFNFNKNYSDKREEDYKLDDDTMMKLQHLISTGKLPNLSNPDNPNSGSYQTKYENNVLRNSYSRALSMASLAQNQLQANDNSLSQMPYTIMNLPVLVPANVYNEINAQNVMAMNNMNSQYNVRQRPPQLPFQIQWPLAPFFPILVKDPILAYLHGGGWNNLIEYGQAADVCSRKQKSADTEENNETIPIDDNELDYNNILTRKSRQARAIKKRTISHSSAAQKLESKSTKTSFNIFNKNKVTKKKPVEEEEIEDPKISKTKSGHGDLKFPFSEYGWFGQRKPVVPSPGFFINRLRVRKGGVAIAGPGGVATAGRGGTAIVGPGGLAYTQPGGMAVAGPAAKIYALPSGTDLSTLVSKLQNQTANYDDDGTVPRSHPIVPEGKLVAIGPVIYFNELE